MSEVFKPNFYEQNNSLNEESKQKNRAVCQCVSLPLWKASAKSDRHMFIMSPVGRSRWVYNVGEYQIKNIEYTDL